MKRALIQFDEETYERLRHHAFARRRSISSVARELIAKGLEGGEKSRPTKVGQMASVAAGRSKQGAMAPISERHDEALAARASKK
jgi:hypothetical protein